MYTTKYCKSGSKKSVRKYNNGGKVPGTNIPASRIYSKDQLKKLEEQRGREEYDREGMNRLAKQAAEDDE